MSISRYSFAVYDKCKRRKFFFIKPKTDAGTIVKKMKNEKKILIKKYPGIGKMGECLRVTTSEKKYMDIFIDALLELDRDE